jgi:predicted RNase H-like nuclease (RuvC/YqgF family)
VLQTDRTNVDRHIHALVQITNTRETDSSPERITRRDNQREQGKEAGRKEKQGLARLAADGLTHWVACLFI